MTRTEAFKAFRTIRTPDGLTITIDCEEDPDVYGNWQLIARVWDKTTVIESFTATIPKKA